MFIVLSVFFIVLSVCWLFEFFILYFGNGASFILCQLLNGGFIVLSF